VSLRAGDPAEHTKAQRPEKILGTKDFDILGRPVEPRFAEPVPRKESRANQPGFVVCGRAQFLVGCLVDQHAHRRAVVICCHQIGLAIPAEVSYR
jgi:hypothetical protein